MGIISHTNLKNRTSKVCMGISRIATSKNHIELLRTGLRSDLRPDSWSWAISGLLKFSTTSGLDLVESSSGLDLEIRPPEFSKTKKNRVTTRRGELSKPTVAGRRLEIAFWSPPPLGKLLYTFEAPFPTSNAWANAPISRQFQSRTIPRPQQTAPLGAWHVYALQSPFP
jgi:hypothetical protein